MEVMLWTLKSLSSRLLRSCRSPGLRRRLELRLFFSSSLIDVPLCSTSSSLKLSLCSWASSSLVREQSLPLIPAAALELEAWLGSRGSEHVSPRTPSDLQLSCSWWGIVFWVSEWRCCLLLQEALLSAVDSLLLLRDPTGARSLRSKRRARSTLAFVSKLLKYKHRAEA